MRRTAEQTVIVAFNARPKAIAIDIPWPDNAPQNFDPLLPAGATRVSAEGKRHCPNETAGYGSRAELHPRRNPLHTVNIASCRRVSPCYNVRRHTALPHLCH